MCLFWLHCFPAFRLHFPSGNLAKTSPSRAGEEEASEEGDQLREPLIVGLASDDEGSVGSVDSSDQDEDDANMPPPISRKHCLITSCPTVRKMRACCP